MNASQQDTEALRSFARNIGMAFQIKDDIMDYGQAQIGKPTGIDLQEQKITQPLLCALQDAEEKEQADIRAKVARAADEPALIKEILTFVHNHKGVEKAAQVLDRFIGQAQDQLEKLADTPEKLYLASLAQFVGAREN